MREGWRIKSTPICLAELDRSVSSSWDDKYHIIVCGGIEDPICNIRGDRLLFTEKEAIKFYCILKKPKPWTKKDEEKIKALCGKQYIQTEH